MKKILGTLVGFLFLGLILLFIQRVTEVRDAAYRMNCNGNLCFLGLCLQNYHLRHGHLPPAYLVDASGTPAHSWRVLLLEEIDLDLFKAYKFDEPRNGPNNRLLESRMPNCYACPSDPNGRAKWQTNYFVVVGNETLFPGPRALAFREVEKPASEPVMLVESSNQAIHWMEPRDFNFETTNFKLNDPSMPGISSFHSKSNICHVDGSRESLGDIPEDQLREMFCIKPSKKNQE